MPPFMTGAIIGRRIELMIPPRLFACEDRINRYGLLRAGSAPGYRASAGWMRMMA